MAQLRQNHDKFLAQDTIVVAIGPEKLNQFSNYFEEHDLPFIGIPDPEYKVLRLYGQQIKIFKFGRMPAQMLVDKEGIIRFVHYADNMSDIPTNEDMLSLISDL